MTRITIGDDDTRSKHSLVAYYEEGLLRFKGQTDTGFSSDAEAFGWKVLGNDDVAGIVAVEFGDSSTRSIKVMKLDYESGVDEV